jgi:hypothetical protein
MTLAFDEQSIQELQRSATPIPDYRQRLFDMYIERMFSRGTKIQGYTKKKTVHALAWLAQRLQEHAQAEFLREKIQPMWLHTPVQKWLYHIGVVVSVMLIVGLRIWLLDWLLEFGPTSTCVSHYKAMYEQYSVPPRFWQYLELYGGWILSLIIGLLVGLRHTITPH